MSELSPCGCANLVRPFAIAAFAAEIEFAYPTGRIHAPHASRGRIGQGERRPLVRLSGNGGRRGVALARLPRGTSTVGVAVACGRDRVRAGREGPPGLVHAADSGRGRHRGDDWTTGYRRLRVPPGRSGAFWGR